SQKITVLDPEHGLVANLGTAALVLSASLFGLPVSTTHVAVGSLFGVGLTTGRANLTTVASISLSWLVTLPCAAAISALVYVAFRPM
ncbi:inorganic phosphate transporter, partial [Clostridioides difficile]|uniref:inorganic phosphate transporter n=1 Tax=Clostridioides difficile TaxID=1496 RepID=UPI0018DC5787